MKRILIICFAFLFFQIGCAEKPEYPAEIKELKKFMDINPKDSRKNRDFIKALYENKFYKDAVKYSQEYQEAHPEEYFGLFYSGLSYEGMNEFDNAERCYKEICDKYPEAGIGHYRMAVLQYEMGNFKECIKNMEQAMTLITADVKNNLEMIYFLAEAYYYDGDESKAYTLLDKALELDPFDKIILYDYGVWLLRGGKYAESVRFLEKLTSQNPQESFPYVRLGKAYYYMHEYPKAEAAFWEASRFNPALKTLAEIVHVQDLNNTYENIDTAIVGVKEKYNYKYGDKYYIRGIVENMGLETAQWVTVVIRVCDKNGNILSQKVFKASPRNIRPEQYVFFAVDVPYNEKISSVKIEPNWHKGSASVYLK